MEPVVSLRGLGKMFRLYKTRPDSLKELIAGRQRSHFEEFWALRDVSLDIHPGETWGLVGPNGSGKSTLLRLAARIYVPTEGEVAVRGRVVPLLELGAGFHPELTGRENVYLNASIFGLSRKDVRTRFERIVDFSELHRFIDTPLKLYSSGMQARLGFAVAIHTHPDVLLLDEVLAVGDQSFQERCLEALRDLRRDGVAIVLVSHALGRITEFCERALWLEAGCIAGRGVAVEVVHKYRDGASM